MKRSGQYKLSGTGSKGTTDNDNVVPGQFRINPGDLPPHDSPVPEFPHMNSLVVTINKMSEPRQSNKNYDNPSGPRGTVNRVEQRVKSFLQRGESKLKLNENSALPPLPQSPEEDVWQYGHVVTLPRQTRHSLALSSSALNHLSTLETASCLSASSGYSSSSSSSYGSFKSFKSTTSSNCSTLPKRKNVSEVNIKPFPARSCIFVDNPIYDITPGPGAHDQDKISHSEIEHDPKQLRNKLYRHRSASVPRCEPVFDDVVEINQQHFKRQSNHRGSAPHHEFLYDERSNLNSVNYICDNSVTHEIYSSLDTEPIYDTIPGELNSPKKSVGTGQHYSMGVTSPSNHHGGPDSLQESAVDYLDPGPHISICSSVDVIKEEDQVAKECREYFEKRLKNSESLKKRWSMSSSDSGADSGDSEISSLCYTSNAPATTVTISPSVSCVADSNSSSALILSSSESQEKSSSSNMNNPLDCKMKFLRKEIASLMKQDNQLFKQLLNLHESISALKTTPAPHSHRPPSPASFGSLTEEEEEEEEEEEKCNDMVMPKKQGLKTEMEENISDVDEGHETDHSLTHSISPTSTLSSKSSRDFQLSSNSSQDSAVTSNKFSRDSTCSKESHYLTTQQQRVLEGVTSLPGESRVVTTNYKETTGKPLLEDLNITSGTKNIMNNRVKRRYSITTNDDFNVNITINNEDISSALIADNPSLSKNTSYKSKSSCYLSKSGSEATNIYSEKTFGGSLGNLRQEYGRKFARTRISIPPSSRNRDHSIRPESFRISSDMDSHTRVLLKARSFAGNSLCSSTYQNRAMPRQFHHSSLQYDQLEKPTDSCNGNPGIKLSRRVTNPLVRSDAVFIDTLGNEPAYDPVTAEDHYPQNFNQFTSNFNYLKSLEIDNKLDHTKEPELDSRTSDKCQKDACGFHEETSNKLDNESFLAKNKFISYEELSGSTTVFPRYEHSLSDEPAEQAAITTTDISVPDELSYLKSQKLRARSFTGMVAPRTTTALLQSSHSEVSDSCVLSKKSACNLKVTDGDEVERKLRVTTMTRRARVTRDGYKLRFSSDLGIPSSTVTPKSKREVFV